MEEYKVYVGGDGGVGKSTLVLQLTTGKFVEEWDPTLEDNYRHELLVDGVKCRLDIYDYAGQDEYSAMQDVYKRRSDGFLYVYNITWSSALDNAASFRDGVLRAQDREHVPMVLVGNMCDEEVKRRVSASEGARLAVSLGCPFMETSAKTRINVEESFAALVRAIRQQPRDANTDTRHPKPTRRRRQASRCALS